MLRQALVVLAVTSVALAAVAIQPLEEKPEQYKDCDGCWVSAINQLIPINQSAPDPTQCAEYRCTADYVQIITCGVVETVPPYCQTVDESQLYPKCCPQVYLSNSTTCP